MKASIAMIAVAAFGCGRLEFAQTSDGAIRDDAARDAVSLDALGTFSAPMAIPGISLSTSDDDDPELTPDLLELYFVSNRPGGLGQSDIWRATRPDITSPWGAPALVTELSSPQSETQSSLCCSGLGMYLGSSRPPAQGTDIFRATRASLTSAWSTPVHVPELSTAAYDAGGTATGDELELIFDSQRGGSVREIYRTTRASTAMAWGPPQRIEELVPMEILNEVDTCLANDNVLVFASARSGSGYFDIWTSSRASRSAPFGQPTNISEINTASAQRDPWMSADGRIVVFAHETAAGDYDIYMATR